jgi:(methylthio)acryloyl-CoA hydratase
MMNFRSLQIEMAGPVAIVTLSRLQRRNAIDESTVEEIGRFFECPRKKPGSPC